MKKLIILSLLVIISAGAASFWYWQKNSYSKEILKLELLGPDQAVVGEEITYTVSYKNNGDVRLEKARLAFEYPKGAFPINEKSLHIAKDLEDIYPGQEMTMSFKARLFGKEGDVNEAKAQMSYQPRNLSSNYESQTKKSTVIAAVPLNFELDVPSKVESGQKFDFNLNYFSQSSYPLANLRIKMEFPDGFELAETNPASIGNNEWQIGVVNRGQGGRIAMKGIMRGGVQEAKIFRATIGMWNEGEYTLLKEVVRGIEISEPRLLVSQIINGSADYIANSGDTLHYEIFFKNVSDRNLENLFLIVNLDGRPYDMQSVKMTNGKFQQGDSSLVWEARDVSKLRFLGRGEEGRVEFWVNVKESWEVFSPQDKNFVLRNRVLLSDAKSEFQTKIQAKLSINQAGYFEDEIFGNEGPIPPETGKSTTYTIIWKAFNAYNDVRNVKVKATLPSEVEMTGKIFPEGASLTFDSASREVVWAIGDMAAGQGIFNEMPSVAFQIKFTPSNGQRNQTPVLIQEARIAGDDTFTGQTVQGKDDSIDTALPDDDHVSEEQGKIR